MVDVFYGDRQCILCSEFTRWLAHEAELEGVDILDSCAASEVLLDGYGSVKGVVTKDMGIAKDGGRKHNYMPGAQVNARVTMFAEGCRGSLAQVRTHADIFSSNTAAFKQ